jgi:hypothetical protein
MSDEALRNYLLREAMTLFRHLPAEELVDGEEVAFRTTANGHLVLGRWVGDVVDTYQLVGFEQPEGMAAMHIRQWLHPEGGAPNAVARAFRDGTMLTEGMIPFRRLEAGESDM